MDNLKAAYIEEASELLTNLEASLLALEENPQDKSNIEQVFRVMHTLKGNSSMFGLNAIADFVHDLETIYDNIRNGIMSLNKELLNCTFASLDHLRLIIYDSELSDSKNSNNHSDLINKIKQFAPSSDSKHNSENTDIPTKLGDHKLFFHIYFEPGDDFLKDGSNPLLLIEEISRLGKSKTIPHFKLPQSTDFDPANCICCWDIFIETEKEKADLQSVFVFAEHNSKIEITEFPYSDALNNPEFKEIICAYENSPNRFNLSDVLPFVYTGTTNTDIELNKTQSEIFNEAVTVKKNNPKEKYSSSIRVASDKLDELMNLVSELVTTQASLSLYTENNKFPELETISENVEKLSRRLRDITFGMTLVPINNMFGRFQRLVRDMSNQLNKDVEFITEGGETELDKSIIDILTDPLMHIIRNSLDHGIENSEERLLNGKPKMGRVLLKAYYSGVFVYIQITDDGRGINTESVRAKAIQKGIIKHDDVLSEKEIFDLIFYPGFSTAQTVTDISGRGVGMDVVKKNITELKGEILVNSQLNQGTTLTIKLPLTLSIIDGLLVSIDNVKYIIPLAVVIKCYEVNNKDMTNNFNSLLLLDEEQIPFINLREVFGYKFDPNDISQMIVVYNGKEKVGISVDFIVGEYQAVIKSLGRYYKNQDFVSGATILGDGTIALVLDTYKIVNLYTKNIIMEENI